MLLHIEFGQQDPAVLSFKLRNTALAHKWAAKVQLAQQLKYTIDEPQRYYGFDTQEQAQARALEHLRQQIRIINNHMPIVHRQITSVHDQDTLNYLHNIFERYHGLLDQQVHPFWNAAPPAVKKALATLNTAVHRCESSARQNSRRAVITYYALPKTHVLADEDYALRQSTWRFGTVHLCYVEIGKTLLDLSIDNDNYIGKDAFQPFMHYSADFVVQFNHSDENYHQQLQQQMWQYYDRHAQFFKDRGFDRHHPKLAFGIFPVADLVTDMDEDTVIQTVGTRQYTNRVWFTKNS